jgi:hypothetical protein
MTIDKEEMLLSEALSVVSCEQAESGIRSLLTTRHKTVEAFTVLCSKTNEAQAKHLCGQPFSQQCDNNDSW